ncbi:hypothetical protein NPS01_32760 [Nocardioides psychrotolerans]|uniref:Uncharacterized conserved protein, DUF1501 family n=1 Tax=Nocardioides psychrotolerans TaxID=1005945 RepID=A0A1I3P8P5_9ACTN|nr:DUF1501 domain-containing protein [Nocardioides psychrotolerans]GEP39613.1 hypothetical protein NPS01_32760 [Nocardioides psychrotolerans]SFJ17928.1 Uncharacterized conserved protein, DUF1501 family [Nocardioides psychrotolerans]
MTAEALPLTGCPCVSDPTSGLPQPRGSTSRRGLLRGAALVGATTMFGSTAVTLGRLPGAAAEIASVAVSPASSVLVVLSLRGAADGLSLVVPHADPAYYLSRPTIAVPSAALLAKDASFGLHPALAPLLPMWESGQLAAVHATGMAVPNRSHFAAMEELEDAAPGSSSRVGWLNRLIGDDAVASTVQGLAVGSGLPMSLIGTEAAMSFRSLETAVLAGGDKRYDPRGSRARSLKTQWAQSSTPMGAGVRNALGALVDLGPAKAQADRATSFPPSSLGQALSSVSRTLRGEIGVSVVTVDAGSWDMHTEMGTVAAGAMTSSAADLATCIAAFFADLGPVADKVTLVTISEFGRRVQENANRGLDHGWGNVMFVAGAGVKGGSYYGRWPGLRNTLDADLAVTTDYRSVLAEIVAARTGASTATVFPGFTREKVGVMVGQ